MKNLFKHLLVISVLAFVVSGAVAAPELSLTKEGKALLTIHTGNKANEETRVAAQKLATYLEKISTASFSVESGDANNSIAVGTVEDFPQFRNEFDLSDALNREDYLLRTSATGIAIIGASERGVKHAVWDFLYRLGYRQFFAGPHWEIVPGEKNLKITVDVKEHPDFFSRSIWSTAPIWRPDWTSATVKPYRDQLTAEWNHWAEVNRLGGSIKVVSGHADQAIIASAREEFKQHPEYYSLVNGKRMDTGKYFHFCYSNPAVQQILIRYAFNYFEKNPDADCVSIEPGDSGRIWCQCPDCQAMGEPSDRMVRVANIVVRAVREKYPQKYVSFYAYQLHADPPTVKLEPGVIVPATTHLTLGKVKSFEDRTIGWRDAGALSGVREYYSVFWWDKGIPRTSTASRVDELPVRLKQYHDIGLRMLNAESNGAWAPNGLGYYLSTRMLWDIKEADNADAIVDDFVEKSFETAAAPMKRFFGILHGAYQTPVPAFNRAYIGQLYGLLDEAFKQTADNGVKTRLNDLAIYVRYLELYFEYSQIDAEDNAALNEGLNKILRFSSPTYMVGMVMPNQMYEAKGNRHWVAKWDNHIYTPPADLQMVNAFPRYQAAWDSRKPYSDQKIQEFIHSGIAAGNTPEPRWNIKVAAAVGASGGTVSFRVRTGTLNSPNRVLLYRPQAGKVKISFDQIGSYLTGQQADQGFYSWQLLDEAGKVLQESNVVDGKRGIVFQAKANTPYTLWLTLNGRVTVEGAGAALQTDLNRGRLHLGGDPHTFYVYVPSSEQAWSLRIKSMTLGETIRATVFAPDGTQVGTAQTDNVTKAHRLTFPPQEGFWKVEMSKASTGAIHDYVVELDKRLAPWASFNPEIPLIVTR